MSFRASGNARVVIKNTFIEVVEDDDHVDVPTRGCYSDSDLESLGTASTATIDDDAPPPDARRALRRLPAPRPCSLGESSSASTDSGPGGGSTPSESSASNDSRSGLSETSGGQPSGDARGAAPTASQPDRLSSEGGGGSAGADSSRLSSKRSNGADSRLSSKGSTCADGSRLSGKGSTGADSSRLSSKGSTAADGNSCGSATPSAFSTGESWSDFSESSEMLDDLQEGKAEWSVGSELHGSGSCRPCLYITSKMGCVSGPRCGFCHQAHERKRRARPSKSTRMHCKQLASMVESSKGSAEVMQVARVVAEESSYLKSILTARIKSPHPIADDAPLAQGGRPAEPPTPAHAEVKAALRQFKQKVQTKKDMRRKIQPGLEIQPVLGRQHSRLSSASSASGSSAGSGGRF